MQVEVSKEGGEEGGDEAPATEPTKMIVMELTAPPPKSQSKAVKEEKKKPLTLTRAPQPQQGGGSGGAPPTRRFSHAGFGQQAAQIQQQHGVNFDGQQRGGGPGRKISLYHNMKFTPIAEEGGSGGFRRMGKENGPAAAGTLNPNAPTFNYPTAQKKYSHPFR